MQLGRFPSLDVCKSFFYRCSITKTSTVIITVKNRTDQLSKWRPLYTSHSHATQDEQDNKSSGRTCLASRSVRKSPSRLGSVTSPISMFRSTWLEQLRRSEHHSITSTCRWGMTATNDYIHGCVTRHITIDLHDSVTCTKLAASQLIHNTQLYQKTTGKNSEIKPHQHTNPCVTCARSKAVLQGQKIIEVLY